MPKIDLKVIEIVISAVCSTTQCACEKLINCDLKII